MEDSYIESDFIAHLLEIGNCVYRSGDMFDLEDPLNLCNFAYEVYNGKLKGNNVNESFSVLKTLESYWRAANAADEKRDNLAPYTSDAWKHVLNTSVESKPKVKRRLYVNIDPYSVGHVVESLVDHLDDPENLGGVNHFKFFRPEKIQEKPYLLDRHDNLVIYLDGDPKNAVRIADFISGLDESEDRKLLRFSNPRFTKKLSRGIGYAAEPNGETKTMIRFLLSSWGDLSGVSFGVMVSAALANAYHSQANKFFQDWRQTGRTILLDEDTMDWMHNRDNGISAVAASAHNSLKEWGHEFDLLD